MSGGLSAPCRSRRAASSSSSSAFTRAAAAGRRGGAARHRRRRRRCSGRRRGEDAGGHRGRGRGGRPLRRPLHARRTSAGRRWPSTSPTWPPWGPGRSGRWWRWRCRAARRAGAGWPGWRAGWRACARRHGVAVVGGNVTRAGELSLTVTVVGAVPARAGAAPRRAPGPATWSLVSGTLGDAALGLGPARRRPRCARRQRRPEPRLALGQAAGRARHAPPSTSPTACSRTSGHLCARLRRRGARCGSPSCRSRRAYRRAAAGRRDPCGAGARRAARTTSCCVAVPPRRLGGRSGGGAPGADAG